MKEKNNYIKIKGIRVHNLKNIDVEIPKNKLVVITGVSGSGKSSLAFDTIYAEGQRRYVESLSTYARQFIGVINKPDIDSAEGLSPAISIDQKTSSNNPRSTVGTITEIYDNLRLLFAKIGTPHCPNCGIEIKKHSINEIVETIIEKFLHQEIIILSPIFQNKTSTKKEIIDEISKSNCSKLQFNNKTYTLNDFKKINIEKETEKKTEIIIDQIKITHNNTDLIKLIEAIEKGLNFHNGIINIKLPNKNKTEIVFSKNFICDKCGFILPELKAKNFSFNSPHGACPACKGMGKKLEINPSLVLNNKLSIAEGGIKPLSHKNSLNNYSKIIETIEKIGANNNFGSDTLISNLTKKQLDFVLYGYKKNGINFDGVASILEKKHQTTESDHTRKELEKYMEVLECPKCNGKKLKKEMLNVKIDNKSIYDFSSCSITQSKEMIKNLSKSNNLKTINKKISAQIIKEINTKLDLLLNIGLDYLTLNRTANTLSGGESQRIRLATQIGSMLSGVLYVLDEPSIGLHQKDNCKLINTLKKLQALGNTVIVVEHDKNIMEASDWIIDVGPDAGLHGGEIITSGNINDIKKNKESYTGQYLAGKETIPLPQKYNKGNGKTLKVIGANEHNLKNIDVEFPLGKFIAITGVSGSGKSTLMTDIISKSLSKKFYRAKKTPGKYSAIEGVNFIDKMVNVNQSPIGKTPRSNPATYTGLFTSIRELFASTSSAKIKGYNAGHFSFNVRGGRCETCKGDGVIKIEMQFLSDIYVKCETCKGQRYNKEVLNIKYKNKTIFEVLEMTIDKAITFFEDTPNIHRKLKTLQKVGLGYIKLGQSATTLSGGEAQRVKLASELSKKSTGKTLYILDEPTTGLHFNDIKKLLLVLQELVKNGNTVLIIEHNLDVVKSVDWIIDMGPEGGNKGGEVIFTGTPIDIIKNKNSHTGQFLKKYIKKS